MEASIISSAKQKVPEFMDFIIPEKPNIFAERMSIFANVTQNPEQVHLNVSLTNRKKFMIRDSSVSFLNGSRVLTSILCSKYGENFGIMCDLTLLPPANREIQHNIQVEMSTKGPLVRYGVVFNKDLSDVFKNLTAQFSASGACGLNTSGAFGAHLWAPIPYAETFRAHTFFNYGTHPNTLFGQAGVGITTKIGERGRIDLNYCFVTGFQCGIGFNYAD